MIIGVSSNIVNGIYILVFDVLLHIFLGWLIRLFLSCRNLNHLHGEGEILQLTNSRLAVAVDYGLSTKVQARTSIAVGTIALTLTIIGGFAIDGRSRLGTTEIVARNVVRIAETADEVLDYSKHVSEDGMKVSGTFLLAREATLCRRSDHAKLTFFSTVNNLIDVRSLEFDRMTNLLNSTCRTKMNGFEEIAVVRTNFIDIREELAQCSFFEEGMESTAGLAPGRAEFQGCDLQIVDTWCARYKNHVCVSQVRSTEGYFLFYNALESQFGRNRIAVDTIGSRSQMDTNIVKSAAFLRGMDMEQNTDKLRIMASSTVTQNHRVIAYKGEVQETVIDLPLLLGTTGVALLATVFVAVGAYVSWKKVAKDSGRMRFNGFNSAMDCMQCAVHVVDGIKTEGKTENVLVGVSRREPHVGPLRATELDDFEDNGGIYFDEGALHGRGIWPRHHV